MKPLSVATLVALAAATCPAGPTEKAIVAAMKLSEKPNYSWTSTVMDDARTYAIEGKTDQRGWTWMRLPMVKSIAQRLGRDAEVEVEAVFKGNEAFVIRTDKGWQTLSELPKKHRDWIDADTVWVMPRSTAGSWGTGGGNWGILFVDRKRVHVRQLSNTTVRRIGASPLEIPDEIRRKLGE
ncbi:MAG: hypothetical protein Q7S40_08920 [Opitutaceae bacterium]|nr:hypothetical protein [Opitutaceae bacterium]